MAQTDTFTKTPPPRVTLTRQCQQHQHVAQVTHTHIPLNKSLGKYFNLLRRKTTRRNTHDQNDTPPPPSPRQAPNFYRTLQPLDAPGYYDHHHHATTILTLLAHTTKPRSNSLGSPSLPSPPAEDASFGLIKRASAEEKVTVPSRLLSLPVT